MRHGIFTTTLIGVAGIVLAGCTSLQTERQSESNRTRGGLAYFLPKRDFVVTFVLTEEKTDAKSEPGTQTRATVKPTIAVSFEASPPYPDFEQAFYIQAQSTILAKKEFSFQVNESGLLNSTAAAAASSAAAATTGGAATGAGAAAGADATKEKLSGRIAQQLSVTAGVGEAKLVEYTCPSAGTFRLRIQPELFKPFVACGYRIDMLTLAGKDSLERKDAIASRSAESTSVAPAPGVFYRSMIPYVLLATAKNQESPEVVQVLMSPNESVRHFAPAGRSVVADDVATMTFSNGILTSYKRSQENELIALLTLPNTVLSEYLKTLKVVKNTLDNTLPTN